METQKINIVLQGVAPVMFDRFIDHSKESRPPEQKLYIDKENYLVLPSMNIDSFLFAEAGGCAKTFEGKKGKDYIRIGQSHVFIEETVIPFTDGKKNIVFSGFNKQVYVNDWGAPRTKNGNQSIKMEKKPRPVLNLPWELAFTINLVKNHLINSIKLENWFTAGGIMIALGTWRPKFGRFVVKSWK